ncbi:uncharacterized protein LOC143145800 [Ptiloglossa arizonensis]|uniref:uncharacterized protein LOC143145800 n=1 Tax=Ptiloglossa arizonensis TaxID=3350558 RepID=UPI003FA01C16
MALPETGFVIAPQIPRGLAPAVEGLAREILRHRPQDIYTFAARHFEQLIKLREKERIAGTVSNRVSYNRRDRVFDWNCGNVDPDFKYVDLIEETRGPRRTQTKLSKRRKETTNRSGWSINETVKVIKRHDTENDARRGRHGNPRTPEKTIAAETRNRPEQCSPRSSMRIVGCRFLRSSSAGDALARTVSRQRKGKREKFCSCATNPSESEPEHNGDQSNPLKRQKSGDHIQRAHSTGIPSEGRYNTDPRRSQSLVNVRSRNEESALRRVIGNGENFSVPRNRLERRESSTGNQRKEKRKLDEKLGSAAVRNAEVVLAKLNLREKEDDRGQFDFAQTDLFDDTLERKIEDALSTDRGDTVVLPSVVARQSSNRYSRSSSRNEALESIERSDPNNLILPPISSDATKPIKRENDLTLPSLEKTEVVQTSQRPSSDLLESDNEKPSEQNVSKGLEVTIEDRDSVNAPIEKESKYENDNDVAVVLVHQWQEPGPVSSQPASLEEDTSDREILEELDIAQFSEPRCLEVEEVFKDSLNVTPDSIELPQRPDSLEQLEDEQTIDERDKEQSFSGSNELKKKLIEIETMERSIENTLVSSGTSIARPKDDDDGSTVSSPVKLSSHSGSEESSFVLGNGTILQDENDQSPGEQSPVAEEPKNEKGKVEIDSRGTEVTSSSRKGSGEHSLVAETRDGDQGDMETDSKGVEVDKISKGDSEGQDSIVEESKSDKDGVETDSKETESTPTTKEGSGKDSYVLGARDSDKEGVETDSKEAESTPTSKEDSQKDSYVLEARDSNKEGLETDSKETESTPTTKEGSGKDSYVLGARDSDKEGVETDFKEAESTPTTKEGSGKDSYVLGAQDSDKEGDEVDSKEAERTPTPKEDSGKDTHVLETRDSDKESLESNSKEAEATPTSREGSEKQSPVVEEPKSEKEDVETHSKEADVTPTTREGSEKQSPVIEELKSEKETDSKDVEVTPTTKEASEKQDSIKEATSNVEDVENNSTKDMSTKDKSNGSSSSVEEDNTDRSNQRTSFDDYSKVIDASCYILTEGSPCEIPESVTTVIIPDNTHLNDVAFHPGRETFQSVALARNATQDQEDHFGEYVCTSEAFEYSLDDVDFLRRIEARADQTVRHDLGNIKEEEEIEKEPSDKDGGRFADTSRADPSVGVSGTSGSNKDTESRAEAFVSSSLDGSNMADGTSPRIVGSTDEGSNTRTEDAFTDNVLGQQDTTINGSSIREIDAAGPYVPELNLDSLRDITMSSVDDRSDSRNHENQSEKDVTNEGGKTLSSFDGSDSRNIGNQSEKDDITRDGTKTRSGTPSSGKTTTFDEESRNKLLRDEEELSVDREAEIEMERLSGIEDKSVDEIVDDKSGDKSSMILEEEIAKELIQILSLEIGNGSFDEKKGVDQGTEGTEITEEVDIGEASMGTSEFVDESTNRPSMEVSSSTERANDDVQGEKRDDSTKERKMDVENDKDELASASLSVSLETADVAAPEMADGSPKSQERSEKSETKKSDRSGDEEPPIESNSRHALDAAARRIQYWVRKCVVGQRRLTNTDEQCDSSSPAEDLNVTSPATQETVEHQSEKVIEEPSEKSEGIKSEKSSTPRKEDIEEQQSFRQTGEFHDSIPLPVFEIPKSKMSAKGTHALKNMRETNPWFTLDPSAPCFGSETPQAGVFFAFDLSNSFRSVDNPSDGSKYYLNFPPCIVRMERAFNETNAPSDATVVPLAETDDTNIDDLREPLALDEPPKSLLIEEISTDENQPTSDSCSNKNRQGNRNDRSIDRTHTDNDPNLRDNLPPDSPTIASNENVNEETNKKVETEEQNATMNEIEENDAKK